MCRSWRRGTTNMSMIHCAYVSGKFRSANATKSAGTIFDLELYRAAIDSRARAILATESRIVLFGFSLRFGFFHSFFFSLPLLLHHLLLALCCFLSFSLLETKQRDRKKERKNWEWVWAPTECCVCGWVDDEAVGVVGRCGGEGWFQQWLRSSCQRDRWNESSWPKHTESFSTPRSFLLGVSSASTSGLLLLHQLPGSVIDSGNNWAVDVMIRFALFCWR